MSHSVRLSNKLTRPDRRIEDLTVMKFHVLAEGDFERPVIEPVTMGRQARDQSPVRVEGHEFVDDIQGDGDPNPRVLIDDAQFPPRGGDLVRNTADTALSTCSSRSRLEAIEGRERTSGGPRPRLGHLLHAGDLAPGLTSLLPLLVVWRRGGLMPSRPTVSCDRPIRGEQALRVPGRLEALPAPLPLARGLVGMLRTGVERAMLAMFHPWREFPLRRTIALQWIRDHPPRHRRQPFEEPAEERLRRLLIPAALHENIQDMAILIDRPPHIGRFPVDAEKDFIQVSRVTRPRVSAPKLIGIVPAERATPLSDGFIRDHGAADEHEFLHISGTEAKAEVRPRRG
jgi:hypothetical protein